MSGTASDRLARLLALVPWLIAHDGVSLTACAQHFGVSVEQLESDLWLLVVCGVPGYGPDQLVDIDFWDNGLIHVIDPQTLGRPLRLTNEEAMTLLVALRMLAQLPGIEDRDAVASAAAKLEAATSSGAVDRFVSVEVAVAPEVRSAIDAALTDRRELAITYASATRDEVTERTIRPTRLFTVDGLSYLEAHCLSADAVRTFRLDRVLAASVGDPFADDAEGDAAPTPSGSTQTQTMVLALEAAARWIIDVHQATVLPEEAGGSSVLVRVPLHSQDWGVRLVMSLQGAARVVEPASLAAAVADAARAALAAYPDRVR